MMFKSIILMGVVAYSAASVGSQEQLRQRRLSFESIAGYGPGSLVSDHNAIDLDQAALEEQLTLAGESASPDDDNNNNALNIYTNGAFSKSYAQLTITPALTAPIAKGADIAGGLSTGAFNVAGSALSDASVGATSIGFKYENFDLNDGRHVNCVVGALPSGSESINLDGCLAATGILTIGGVGYTYTYNPLADNNSDRTLAGFSEQAQAKMFDCGAGKCPYKTYSKFYDYYGVFDYGDQWIRAAFAGTATNNFQNGYADFSDSTQIGRSEAIQKGTAYMNVWMYVIREFEDALDDCSDNCIDCNDASVHAWDEGVAFYTGSLQGTDGSGEGKLLYQLANKRCANYKTCGEDGNSIEGNSYINRQLFRHFKAGQGDLLQGKCADARVEKEAIEELMAVPLVQGTIRYAFKTEKEIAAGEKEDAEGAVFAASVLPLVHSCDAGDAQTIYDNMRLGNGGADFEAVKAAFERNYNCMGITCAQVGGLWNEGDGEYYTNAAPCGSGSSSSSSSGVGTSTVVIIAGVAGGVVLAALAFYFCRKRNTGKDVDFAEEQQQEEAQYS